MVEAQFARTKRVFIVILCYFTVFSLFLSKKKPMTHFEYNLSSRTLRVVHVKEDDFYCVMAFNTAADDSLDVSEMELVWTISDSTDILITMSGPDLEIIDNEVEFTKAASFFSGMSLMNTYAHRLYDDVTNETLLHGQFKLETSGAVPVETKKHWYFGASALSVSTSAAVKSLPGSVFQTTPNFVLITGTTHKKFIIALPVTVDLVSVTDQSALGVDITSQYVLQGQVSVTDVNNNTSSYNIYEMNIGIPYSTSHNHYITTS